MSFYILCIRGKLTRTKTYFNGIYDGKFWHFFHSGLFGDSWTPQTIFHHYHPDTFMSCAMRNPHKLKISFNSVNLKSWRGVLRRNYEKFNNILILNYLAKCDARIFGTEVKYAVPCIKTICIDKRRLGGSINYSSDLLKSFRYDNLGHKVLFSKETIQIFWALKLDNFPKLSS